MKSFKYLAMSAMIGSALVLGACGAQGGAENGSGEQLSGNVKMDGSSTVAPIMEAVNEEYAATQPDVKVSIGVSGSGGGFEKFIAGETDLSNASRPIKDEEKQKLEEAGIDFTEFEVAKDGLTIVVNKENDWAEDMTVEDLQKLWVEDGKTKKWSDINPEWPDEEVKFYSPGTDSGTYDYFNEVVLEEKDMVKQNIQLSEDDNVLVQGVTGDKNAIGFFGYAYYLANKEELKAVKIGGVEPNNETIESGEYTPLSRPLFVYAKNASVKDNEAVYDFMKFTLDNSAEMAEAVGYVSLPEDKIKEATEKLEGLK
ncbi:PstS family phosphate ABC transporter substrate-binding protein [Rossellomorea aquimaris]|jgi:phosphate transport system substrate-binding protein|uniref:Phosphate-binding protein n=1 Tax=Rossellomorea aquimaris TaxID=189382 RepID=A0A5D4TTX2_9BACI|nr:PstS family phosphate ABC transporter substrate-binding protein [Rossellomorea aquimaris]TYS77654.1 PstS family phosphate ABC transporter substrate-binding protein [Rossellomorea aquimaris]TYS86836.1 PstS family phosphate ABC transporter substrate-binding protein [Rossellomorea aquimaris]